MVRENDRCSSVDTGTLMKSKVSSKPGHPVYFITCNNDGGPFNVWFGPTDVTSGRAFAALQNVGQSDAVMACEEAAKEAANNPQTVHFSHFMDIAFATYANGNSRLLSSFTARNAFGVESKFRIECFFEGSVLTERDISPT